MVHFMIPDRNPRIWWVSVRDHEIRFVIITESAPEPRFMIADPNPRISYLVWVHDHGNVPTAEHERYLCRAGYAGIMTPHPSQVMMPR